MAKKRIILLLDGTWNDEGVGASDTNIIRLRTLVAETLGRAPTLQSLAAGKSAPKIVSGYKSGDDIENYVFYERGVGTSSLDRFRGGVFGKGLTTNVRRAYKFLSGCYEPGDEIFIFGFSRGAYTARSLVGLIGATGLLKRDFCTSENEKLAWEYYRTSTNDRLPGIKTALAQLSHDQACIQIECVGVFDTVGALGVPLRPFWRANRDRYEFHDVHLSSITKVNLHAVAIDENREPFEAAVWRKPRFKRFATHTEQVWFPGAHADIGGGYINEETRALNFPIALDDIALDWMIKRVLHYCPEFPIDPSLWKQVDENWSGGQQHQPRKWFYRLMRYSLRSIANYKIDKLGFFERNVSNDRLANPIAEMVHVSALERLGTRAKIDKRESLYAPKNLLSVLDFIESTYPEDGVDRNPGPDIRIVDWSGAVLDPGTTSESARARRIVVDAKGRLTGKPAA